VEAPSPEAVTTLLKAWSRGDVTARDQLFPIVYAELRRRAAGHLGRERRGHTLQPTALVHEAYLRMSGKNVGWKNRTQFFAVASQIMRRILVDHARSRLAAERPGSGTRVTLGEPVSGPREVDLIALDDALVQLEATDPRQARMVELRFFGGLTHEEVALALGVSLATVNREWRLTKAWLYQRVATGG